MFLHNFSCQITMSSSRLSHFTNFLIFLQAISISGSIAKLLYAKSHLRSMQMSFQSRLAFKEKGNIRCSEKHMLNYLCAVPATSVEEQIKFAMTVIHLIKNPIFGLFFFSNCTVCKISHPKKARSQFKSDHLSFLGHSFTEL